MEQGWKIPRERHSLLPDKQTHDFALAAPLPWGREGCTVGNCHVFAKDAWDTWVPGGQALGNPLLFSLSLSNIQNGGKEREKVQFW